MFTLSEYKTSFWEKLRANTANVVPLIIHGKVDVRRFVAIIRLLLFMLNAKDIR